MLVSVLVCASLYDSCRGREPIDEKYEIVHKSFMKRLFPCQELAVKAVHSFISLHPIIVALSVVKMYSVSLQRRNMMYFIVIHITF